MCNFLSNSNHVDFLEEQIKLTQLDPQSLSLVHRARRRSIKKRVDIVSAVPHLRDYGERGLLPSIGARRRLRRPEVSTRQRGHAVLRHRRQTSGRACTSADARCSPRLGSSRPHPPLGQLYESRDQRRRWAIIPVLVGLIVYTIAKGAYDEGIRRSRGWLTTRVERWNEALD